MASGAAYKRIITLISLILGLSLVVCSVAFAQPSTNHAPYQKAKASQDALVIKTPSSQEADVGEQQELTVKVGLGDNRLKPVKDITYHTANGLSKDNIDTDLKAMNNLSSGRSCLEQDGSVGKELDRKKSGDETCKFVFKIESPNSTPTNASGDIQISGNGSQVKKQSVSVNIIKPALSISKTLFTEPNSSSDHKGFIIKNNSDANIFINSATIPSNQPFDPHGVTLSDEAFVHGLGDTDKCNIISKDKAAPDKALKPGKSCRINLDVANDARHSTNIKLEGNFGTKKARVNIPQAHIEFSGKDNSTPIPAIFVKDDGTQKEVDIKNTSQFQIHINDVVSVNKRVDIPDGDNNCKDKDLSSDSFCTLKIKDDGDLSRTDVDYLKVKSPSLSVSANEQYLFVGTTGTVNLVPLSRHFLQTGESFITPSKQSYPNTIVYRVYNNQSSGDITIENRDDFLSNLSGDLAKSDFDLTACYKSDGTRITAGNKLSSGTSCDRMLIFTQTTPLNDQIARARFDAQEGDSTQTNQLTDQYVFSDLYVGGQFISAGERPNTTNIAAWGISKEAGDSKSHANRKRAWKPLGAMDQGSVVHALTTTRSGNIVSSDLNSNDVDKVLKGNALYVGGSFDDIEENASLGNIAFWQGDDLWSSVEASSVDAGGTTGTVYSLDAEPSGDLASDEDASLYVAGNFDEVATNDVSNVARWTVDQADRRSTWRKLEETSSANQQPSDAQTPAGANGTVLSAFWKGSDTVMLAGEFDKAGGSGALSDQKVAEWDRSKEAWSNVGSSTSVFQPLTANQNDLKVQINSFKELDGETVAGGRFKVDTSSLASSDQFLALLDGKSWIKFPDEKLLKNDKLKTSGVDTMARADGNDVFGGSFEFDSGSAKGNYKNLMVGEIKSSGCSGSNPCFNLNTSFEDPANDPNGRVLAIQGVGSSDNVFLGGDFTNIQGGTHEHIVKFTNFDDATTGDRLLDNGEGISDQGSVKALAIMNKLEPEFPSG